MIEKQLEQRFRAAVADEPPLGFDPDELVDLAGRRRQRRRAMTATALATCAVAVTAVAVLSAAGEEPPVADRRSYPPAACLSSPQDVDRVLDQVWQSLTEYAPGTTFDPDSNDARSVAESGETCGLTVIHKRAGGTPGQDVTVGLSYGDHRDPLTGESWYELTDEVHNPDGSVLRTYRKNADVAPPEADEVVVLHLRPNGMAVRAGSDPDLVSLAEVTALATDPRLTF